MHLSLSFPPSDRLAINLMARPPKAMPSSETTKYIRYSRFLALPIKLAGDINSSSSEWTIEDTRSSIENIPNESTNFGTPDNPIKHRVEPGETAYSIARLYNVSITSLSKWNGLDADLNVIIGRELIIPVISNKKNTNLEVASTKPKEKITLEKIVFKRLKNSKNAVAALNFKKINHKRCKTAILRNKIVSFKNLE